MQFQVSQRNKALSASFGPRAARFDIAGAILTTLSRRPARRADAPFGASGLRRLDVRQLDRRSIVGKYVLAWLLGVPAFVLVIIYLLFH